MPVSTSVSLETKSVLRMHQSNCRYSQQDSSSFPVTSPGCLLSRRTVRVSVMIRKLNGYKKCSLIFLFRGCWPWRSCRYRRYLVIKIRVKENFAVKVWRRLPKDDAVFADLRKSTAEALHAYILNLIYYWFFIDATIFKNTREFHLREGLSLTPDGGEGWQDDLCDAPKVLSLVVRFFQTWNFSPVWLEINTSEQLSLENEPRSQVGFFHRKMTEN